MKPGESERAKSAAVVGCLGNQQVIWKRHMLISLNYDSFVDAQLWDCWDTILKPLVPWLRLIKHWGRAFMFSVINVRSLFCLAHFHRVSQQPCRSLWICGRPWNPKQWLWITCCLTMKLMRIPPGPCTEATHPVPIKCPRWEIRQNDGTILFQMFPRSPALHVPWRGVFQSKKTQENCFSSLGGEPPFCQDIGQSKWSHNLKDCSYYGDMTWVEICRHSFRVFKMLFRRRESPTTRRWDCLASCTMGRMNHLFALFSNLPKLGFFKGYILPPAIIEEIWELSETRSSI